MRSRTVSSLTRLALDLLNLPLYLLAAVVPKDPHLWLLGAWNGDRFADSPKALLENLGPEAGVRAVWLSRRRDVVAHVRAAGFEAHDAHSLMGYWLSLRAKVGIICTGRADLNRFVTPPVLVNTWHGIALKHVMFDYRMGKPMSLRRRFFHGIFPFERNNPPCDLTVCSEGERARMASAFRLDESRVHVTGLPRNDVLLRKRLVAQPGTRPRIVYMPTHRKTGAGDVTSWLLDAMPEIEAWLEVHDAELLVRLHYYHASEAGSGSPRVRWMTDPALDVYELLTECDVLITDYSSIMFDFLLTDRPVVLGAFDLEEYVQDERGMYFPYADIAPGPIGSTWAEVLDHCEDAIRSPELWAERRARVRDELHQHQDGRATARVLELVRELSGSRG